MGTVGRMVAFIGAVVWLITAGATVHAGELRTPYFWAGPGTGRVECSSLNLGAPRNITVTLVNSLGNAHISPTVCGAVPQNTGCNLTFVSPPPVGDYWCRFSFPGPRGIVRGSGQVLDTNNDPRVVVTAY